MTAKVVKGPVAPGAVAGAGAMAVLRDLLVLAKARVVSLLVFTGAVGAVLAPGFSQHLLGAAAGLLGIALAGGAGGVINQLIEPSLDQHMRRTRRRPLAVGRISRRHAVLFAAVLFVASVLVLLFATNLWTLAFTLIGTLGYGVIYTVYLKPNTPWNIVWGGIGGALPPIIGWTAAGGAPDALLPWSLVMLVSVWTPAHFWPLAICCREDYAKACIPMLPVTHGVDRTRREIVNYAIATLIVSLIPVIANQNLLYAVAAAGLGLYYLGMTLKLRRMPVGDDMDRYARRVFQVSISYLFALFTLLVIGHYMGPSDVVRSAAAMVRASGHRLLG
ncbi:heme o synthase [Acidiferrobacter sp.]|uniref:heme o synthase n=1 Tax=Acidiferrobacter sp. TaxID=1872107 RepID=UPI00263706C9|nr:heme o synthase [Acidiferrobacter sp.]